MLIDPGVASPRRTKLRAPRLPSDVIARPRLLARLNRLAALTLIIAPAGYGKTTLVCTWLAQLDRPSAWLSLADEDNDPAAFLTSLVASIRTLFPGFASGLLERFDAMSEQTLNGIASALANELDALDREFVLVLDDYHFIHDATIHQLVGQLLIHPPRSLYLVIAARHDLPVPWNLRTSSLTCELRARDLSFTTAETAEFLAKVLNRSVDITIAKDLTEQSEGWITSLRLAALNVSRRAGASAQPILLENERRGFADYFASEVMKYLPDGVSEFLMRISILDTLTGELCDFLLTDTQFKGRGAVLLKQLEAEGIFITALDNAGIWYRLHPLFRSTLYQRLQETVSSAEVAVLYERSVAWHEEQGLLEEASRYALAGGQVATAAALLGRHRQQILDDMDFYRLGRWLRQFPPSAVDMHIDLLLAKAWLMYTRAERLEVHNCLRLIEGLLATSTAEEQQLREWNGEIAALISTFHIYSGDGAAAALAGQHALEQIPRERFFVRTVAILHVSMGLYMIGQPGAANSLLAECSSDDMIARDLALLRVQHVRHHVQLLTADIRSMCAEFPNLLQLATAREMKLGIAWAHYYWGCASYLQNHLTSASEHFRAVLAIGDHAYVSVYTHSAIGLALTLQAQGAPDEATTVVDDLQHRLGAMRAGEMLKVSKAFAADLALRQGRNADALRWLAEDASDLSIDAVPMFYTPGLTAVKVLITAAIDPSYADAQAWLDRVFQLAVQTRNILVQIKALALQAVLSEAAGDRPRALAALERSLAMAEQRGVFRVFVDLGRQLTPLVALLASSDLASEFSLEVRNAIELDPNTGVSTGHAVRITAPGAGDDAAGRVASGDVNLPQASAIAVNGGDLSQLLTNRELDVMHLLEQRLTNKEIARRLGISTETVRQHTIRIFRKLNVANRRQAIVAARALGFDNVGK